MKQVSLLFASALALFAGKQAMAQENMPDRAFDLNRYVEITTSFEPGQQLKVACEDGVEAWFDLNGNEEVDEGEIVFQAAVTSDDYSFLTIDKQTLRVYGKFKEFFCIESGLTKADFSNCLDIETICLSKNELENLEVKALSQLRYLECMKNKISELDVTGLSKLEVLAFQQNMISMVDLSGKPDLNYIAMARNRIVEPNMQVLVEALPQRSDQNIGAIFALSLDDEEENYVNQNQHAIAYAKQWFMKAWDPDQNKWILFWGFSSMADVDAAYALKAYYQDSNLHLDNLSLGQEIEIYSVAGKLLHSQLATSIDQSLSLRLPLGIYIVKNASQSMKFVVR